MSHSFWISPIFIISVLVTLGAGFYSFVYSRIHMHKAYRQSLLILARAVETKDSGSLGHGERVAAYVVALAKALRLNSKEIRKMEYAAFLQDIGNVRVPHAILNKSTRLDAEEFEILKRHCIIGADMVEQITFLKPIAPIVRHHHESWDGSGYPDGLVADGIPLGSRILAVCTAFDSMMNTRAYREKMSEDDAIRLLRAHMGTKYDPDIVRVFLRVQRRLKLSGGKQ